MKFKKGLLFLLALIIAPVFVLANFPGPGQVPDVPPEIRNTVPESEWVEVFCYVGRYRGAEGVVKAETLAELLPPAVKEVEDEFQVSIEVPDFLGLAHELTNDLNEACQQKTLEGIQKKLREYIAKTDKLRVYAREVVKNQIQPILEKKGKEIEKELQKKLEKRGQELKKEAEQELRRQVQEEIKQIRARISAQIEQEVREEMTQRAAAGEFGENPDISELNSIGQELAFEKEQQARKQATAELQAKYRILAQEAKERIKAQLANEAEKIGGEKRKKLMGFKSNFERIFVSELEQKAQEKMSPWVSYKDKAISKKQRIIYLVIKDQIIGAQNAILDNKDKIEIARQAGIDILPAEELIAYLKQKTKKTINKLDHAQYNTEEDIRSAVNEIKKIWDDVRISLEQIEASGPAYYYRRLKESIGFLTSQSSIKEIEKRIREREMDLRWYEGATKDCNTRGFSYNNLPDWGLARLKTMINTNGPSAITWSDVNTLARIQIWCQERFTLGQGINDLGTALENIIASEKNYRIALLAFSSYNENYPLEELVKYKKSFIKSQSQELNALYRIKIVNGGLRLGLKSREGEKRLTEISRGVYITRNFAEFSKVQNLINYYQKELKKYAKN